MVERPRYKLTEAGMLPETWEVGSLGRNCEIITKGTTPTSLGRAFKRNGINFLKAETISDGGKIVREKLAYIDSATHALLKRSQLKANDVLISIAGVLGRVGMVDESDLPANTNQALAIVRLGVQSQVGRDFLFFALKSPYVIRQIRDITVQAAQANISLQNVRDFLLPIPPIPEQRAIASALIDVDALLDGLDRLIIKKRALKQAAMQQLLSGRIRLPGFRGEWEMRGLGDLGPFLKGRGVTKDQANGGTLPCVRYGELYTHHNNVIRGFFSWISPAVAMTATRLCFGDILFAGSGETKEEIGKCAAFVNEQEAYAGGDIVILRPHDANPIFLGYLLNSVWVNRQKASRGQGDAVVHISSSALAAIRCLTPKPPEQAAIAAVLSDMDAEIAALEVRRDKSVKLKQAMMHELFTGKSRLMKSEPAHA